MIESEIIAFTTNNYANTTRLPEKKSTNAKHSCETKLSK